MGLNEVLALIGILLGALVTVGVAVAGYLSAQRASWRERQAQMYAEALRAVEDYLEGPYRIRRRDGSAASRSTITTWLSDVKSRHNLYLSLLQLHSSPQVADAYEKLLGAAREDAAGQMNKAWKMPPTTADDQVELTDEELKKDGYPRINTDEAKPHVVKVMRQTLRIKWWHRID